MHRGFFLPVKALPPVPNGPETGGGRCPATYLCRERFNSRPPRGGRLRLPRASPRSSTFQSTPSARRATRQLCDRLCNQSDFNPRPPRGGRQLRHKGGLGLIEISIHALREESDDLPQGEQAAAMGISIHALREEGDFGKAVTISAPVNISIHALRGESDRNKLAVASGYTLFQSTPSARRATSMRHRWCNRYMISIHALREEGDVDRAAANTICDDFNPRPPRGGRPEL